MSTRILVVDDEKDVELLFRQKFRKEVKRKSLELVFAFSGQEALDILKRSNPPKVVYIFSDINMPGMTGLELFDKLANITSIPRRALLTANIQDSVRERAEKIGVVFLNKPINEAIITPFLFDK